MSVQVGLLIIGIFFIFVFFFAYYLTKREKQKQEWINSLTDEELKDYNNQIEIGNLKQELADAKSDADFWFFMNFFKK